MKHSSRLNGSPLAHYIYFECNSLQLHFFFNNGRFALIKQPKSLHKGQKQCACELFKPGLAQVFFTSRQPKVDEHDVSRLGSGLCFLKVSPAAQPDFSAFTL